MVDAVRIAKRVGAEPHQGPVYMLGMLVHNHHVTDDLREHGVELVDGGSNRLELLEKIDSGTVIFTAHGISPAVRERAVAKGLKAIDATCSDVVRTHSLVKRLVDDGYEVIYIGRHGHPEPEGVIGEAPGHVHLIEDESDLEKIELDCQKIAVTTQTTLSMWDTAALIDRVKARYPQAEVHNEICMATQERQEAAAQQARDCDLVIVVGSPRSSNSRRLVEVVRDRAGRPAYLVDDIDEIDPRWFRGVRKVGVTSGASTPSQLTRRVIEHIEAIEPFD